MERIAKIPNLMKKLDGIRSCSHFSPYTNLKAEKLELSHPPIAKKGFRPPSSGERSSVSISLIGLQSSRILQANSDYFAIIEQVDTKAMEEVNFLKFQIRMFYLHFVRFDGAKVVEFSIVCW
ncbi:uncharacterized protein LOC120267325 [Dioscorea cayenensis subsp. rotundata]|uniref:Uncharacterized protein LOC120267325 n=1 Tax=Dioscorea cayennensis subsp. rotundata TaxID=55577 RepID=A0AB40BTY8_DIOCR|nr:uncharacterized protein LOC120267325 [Dioscorea cayenensis subsp. rotundata]